MENSTQGLAAARIDEIPNWPCRAAWKDVAGAKPYPTGFRDDVVHLARNPEPGVTIEQMAKDFGVHPMTLQFPWSTGACYTSVADGK